MCDANPLDGFGAVSAVTKPLLGGGKGTQATHNSLPQATQQDLADLLSEYKTYGSQTEDQYNAASQTANQETGQNQQAQDLFRQHLINFVGADSGVNPSPEELARATSFVDQTFTKPMQNQIDQYNSRFSDSQNAQAAALGRAPGSDQATQQAIYTSGLQNLYNLQAQRGSQIQQQALAFNQGGFDRSNAQNMAAIYGGQQLGQNSQFLNGLAQNAFNNRINLMNGRAGLAGIQQVQSQNRDTAGQAGLLPTISGAIGQVNSISQGIGQLGGGGGGGLAPEPWSK